VLDLEQISDVREVLARHDLETGTAVGCGHLPSSCIERPLPRKQSDHTPAMSFR
jgi:hypothetical protein